MKQKPGWVLPDLKEAQKRTTNTIDRIDTFTIPEVARMMGRGKKYFISTFFYCCTSFFVTECEFVGSSKG